MKKIAPLLLLLFGTVLLFAAFDQRFGAWVVREAWSASSDLKSAADALGGERYRIISKSKMNSRGHFQRLFADFWFAVSFSGVESFVLVPAEGTKTSESDRHVILFEGKGSVAWRLVESARQLGLPSKSGVCIGGNVGISIYGDDGYGWFIFDELEYVLPLDDQVQDRVHVCSLKYSGT